MNDERADWLGPRAAGLTLLAVCALVLGVRALGFEWVFVGDDVVFPPADPQYHVRRSLYSFHHFPRVLMFDPYINYPDGAPVPWPPLFDFVVGGLARVLASSERGFEVVIAWASPVCAALTLLPIYQIGKRVASRAVGVGAGALFALVPIGVNYSHLGNADHHAAVSLIGAWLLFLCCRLVDPSVPVAGLRRLAAALVVVRAALLLTWHGSLLYLGLAEATLLLAAAFGGRRELMRVQSWSALATAVLLLPVLLLAPTPLGGDYSSIALSRLHVLAMLAVAAVSGGVAWTEARWPARGPATRIGWMAAAALGFAALVLLLPGPREGLVPAFLFLSMQDGIGQVTGEQSPLFTFFARSPVRPATYAWGFFAYVIPLAPLAGAVVAWRAKQQPAARAAGWVLALWGAFFGALAIVQRRYGNDFAPAACVLFALGLGGLARASVARSSVARSSVAPLAVRSRSAIAACVAVAAALALLAPALTGLYWPRVRGSWGALSGDPGAQREAAASVATTLTRFSREVRRVTPETAGYLGPGVPEYGILAHANIGHALQYVARRATATDPFWSYIGPENWDRSFAFLAAKQEDEALALAKELRGRYVVTMPEAAPGSVVARLHEQDGLGVANRPPLAHFRLVIEAPAGGHAVGEIFRPTGRSSRSPYKLFEIVEGAVLEVPCEPGDTVLAVASVSTPGGRTFVYQTQAVAGEDGLARLRVSYASDGESPTRANGPYRVRAGAREWDVTVPEQAVLHGESVRVGGVAAG